MMAEIWELYDAEGRKTGETLTRGEPLPEERYHLAVEVWVTVGGRVLVTKRDPAKEWMGGFWEVPGGGVLAGESAASAASRELYEEAGVICDPSELLLLGRERVGSCIVESYLLCRSDTPAVSLQPGETVDYALTLPGDYPLTDREPTKEELDRFGLRATPGTLRRMASYGIRKYAAEDTRLP